MRLTKIILILIHLIVLFEAFRAKFNRSGTPKQQEVKEQSDPDPKPKMTKILTKNMGKLGKLQIRILRHLHKIIKLKNFLANVTVSITSPDIPKTVYKIIFPKRLNRIM